MKKFQIEYEGKTVQHIEADKIKYDRRHGNTMFYVRASERLVAVVPRGYMVIEIGQTAIVETCVDKFCKCEIPKTEQLAIGYIACLNCNKQVKNEENAG